MSGKAGGDERPFAFASVIHPEVLCPDTTGLRAAPAGTVPGMIFHAPVIAVTSFFSARPHFEIHKKTGLEAPWSGGEENRDG